MALDKLVDSAALDANLTSVANAIRAKGGISGPMAFPTGFVAAVEAIPKKETVSWHQCPEMVRSYLAAAAAAYSDPDVTIIDQYAPARGHEVVSNTKPVGYTKHHVNFSHSKTAVSYQYRFTSFCKSRSKTCCHKRASRTAL